MIEGLMACFDGLVDPWATRRCDHQLIDILVIAVIAARLERVDLALYLGLGWMIVVAWEPLVSSIDETTLVLVVIGGALYTIGTAFHV